MRCSKCGTLIEGSNGACPLCGAPTVVQAPVYPHRNARLRRYVVPFTVIYWLLALLATVIVATLGYFYEGVRHHWAIVLVALSWVYLILRRTVLGLENLHYKVLINTIMGLMLIAVIGFVLHREDVLIGWVMPIFYAASWALGGAIALSSLQKNSRYILGLWWQGLLAVAIFALCFSLKLYWVPSVVCGGIGLLLCLVITLTHPREVWSQIKSALDR
jgi:hypothetical protein